jgi:uncharacterized protein
MNARNPQLADATFEAEALIALLRSPSCYAHPAAPVEVMETHISWVILAGDYAYKIKKPVNFGFLDFSTLAARRHYCEEEVRLNRRYAPDLYLGVTAISGDPGAPQMGGTGPALEYAVKMRRFDQSALLSAMLARSQLNATTVVALARTIAGAHAFAADASQMPGDGTATNLFAPMTDNFRQMLSLVDSAETVRRLERLREWTQAEHQRLARLHAQRLSGGRIRECHGDLHLGNIVLLEGQPVPFDCIEFNPALRWIDTMSEVAFTMMDLAAHGRDDLAYTFINAYLEADGDYAGIPLLPVYLVYRALVRAKVSLLRASESRDSTTQRDNAIADFERHTALADAFSQHHRGAVIITHGLSGSGKTTLTQPLMAKLGAIRMRSDIERKRMHGLSALAPATSAVNTGIYTREASARTYAQLCSLARGIAAAGFPALVDATFLKRRQRAMFRQLARQLRVPFVIISIAGEPELLRAHIAERTAKGGDSSDATPAVLDRQIAAQEPLNADELREAVVVDASNGMVKGGRDLQKAVEQRL